MPAHPGAQPFEDVVDQWVAGAGQAVMHPLPVALDLDQAGPAQLGEMTGDLWLVEPEGAVEIADADRFLGEQVQEAQPGGVGERFKELRWLDGTGLRHGTHIRHIEYVCQDIFV